MLNGWHFGKLVVIVASRLFERDDCMLLCDELDHKSGKLNGLNL